jgi:hypothetical protein
MNPNLCSLCGMKDAKCQSIKNSVCFSFSVAIFCGILGFLMYLVVALHLQLESTRSDMAAVGIFINSHANDLSLLVNGTTVDL